MDDVALHSHRQFRIQLLRRHQHQVDALRVLGQQRKVDLADALLLPFAVQPSHPPGRDQAAEPAIGGAGCRIG